MIRLVRFFRGFVLCEVTGGYFAKLLSLLVGAGIAVVKSRATKLGGELVIPAGEYRAVRPLAKRAQCRVRVKKRYGLIFQIKKNRYFWTSAVSVLVFAAALIFLSTRIVGIEYVGSTSVRRSAIDASLAQNGVYIGAPRSGLSGYDAAQGLLSEFENLAWAAVNKHPFYVRVELAEKTSVPAPAYPSGRVMLAKHDAVVTELTLIEGVQAVSVGETVHAGQTLAYGGALPSVSSRVSGVSGVCRGIVLAELEIPLPETVTTRLLTGNSRAAAQVSIFGKRIFSSPFGQRAYAEYDVSCMSFTPRLFGVYLPVRVERTVFLQTRSVRADVGGANAVYFCEKLALEMLAREYGDFVMHHADYSVGGSLGRARILLETEISEMISP